MFVRQGRTYQTWPRLIAVGCFAVTASLISGEARAAQGPSSVGYGHKTLVCRQNEIPVLSFGPTKIRTKTGSINLNSASLCLGANRVRHAELKNFHERSPKLVIAAGYWVLHCQKNYAPLAVSEQTRITGSDSDYFVEIATEKGIATCLNQAGNAKG